jgi:hypothetical protein
MSVVVSKRITRKYKNTKTAGLELQYDNEGKIIMNGALRKTWDEPSVTRPAESTRYQSDL